MADDAPAGRMAVWLVAVFLFNIIVGERSAACRSALVGRAGRSVAGAFRKAAGDRAVVLLANLCCAVAPLAARRPQALAPLRFRTSSQRQDWHLERCLSSL